MEYVSAAADTMTLFALARNTRGKNDVQKRTPKPPNAEGASAPRGEGLRGKHESSPE
ncbi:hypothetical protein [Paracoccus liaowanqingii]|uniref:hypothetical protein n=1 Tax=Paracoccus liaowanqingii TaxID=2560053 RepID=UPI00143D7917|nr:hypothetical protein [Paracoccus liaowanqingii]